MSSCTHSHAASQGVFLNFELFKCNECDLVYRNIREVDLKPSELYKEYYYKNESVGRFLSPVEIVVRAFRLFRAFKLRRLYPSASTILDIGCGRGFTLYYLRKFFNFKRTAGTQICEGAYLFSKEELKLEIYNNDLLELDFSDKSFDLVTLWHVLEHVTEPELYLRKVHQLLTDDGAVVIEVPNYSSWTRRFTREFWLGLDLEYHLSFFEAHTLIKLLRRCGFEPSLIHTFSLEYSIFISTQSLVSRFMGTQHTIFSWLQGRYPAFPILDWMLFIVLLPFCMVVNLALYHSKRGEVLLIKARKTPS